MVSEREEGPVATRIVRRMPVGPLVFSALAAVFMWYVWPTAWRYDKMGSLTLRTNRFSGKVEELSESGWRNPPPPPAQPLDRVPAAELDLIRIDTPPRFAPGATQLYLDVYNGTRRALSSITVNVVVEQDGNAVLSRPYQFTPAGFTAPPLTSEHYSAEFGFTGLSSGQTFAPLKVTAAKINTQWRDE